MSYLFKTTVFKVTASTLVPENWAPPNPAESQTQLLLPYLP